MRCVLWSIGMLGVWMSIAPPIHAQQVTADGTLNTTVTRTGNDFTILNGTARGTNLFHSFQEFSLPSNGSATFDLISTPSISTIFSRVTGGIPSNIDGTIRTINSATPVSLFLLNPSGILLGANARLAIGGSFVGTTANGIRFADGVEFTASAIEPPLLTISAPIGLRIGQTPGAIRHQSSNFAVQPGQGLALIGGNVAIEGGRLIAPSGRIDIAALDANGAVNFNAGVFRYPTQSMQDIQLNQAAVVSTSGDGGGTIQVQGRQIFLRDATSIASNNNSGANNGGSIRINATERLELTGTTPDESVATNITARVRAGTGQGSRIEIVAPQLKISDGAQIVSRTDADGNGGNITIQAENVEAIGESTPDGNFATGIISRTGGATTGRGGDVTITAQTVKILDGAEFRAISRGNGDAGNFTVRARDLTTNSTPVTINYAGISTGTRGGSGNGGDILLELDSLNILGGSAIRSTTGGSGRSGNITIRAKTILLQGEDAAGFTAQLLTQAEEPTTTGKVGDIRIDTEKLRVLDGSFIVTGTHGISNAGDVLINARDVEVSGVDLAGLTPSTIQSSVFRDGTGQGGQVNINADRIRVTQGAQLVTATIGEGNAGSIALNARSIEVAGISGQGISSAISAAAAGNANVAEAEDLKPNGNAGTVTIRADQLRVADGAFITTYTSGAGNAGKLDIAAKTVDIVGSGFSAIRNQEVPSVLDVRVSLDASGQGGQINLVADQLRLTEGGHIISSTLGAGNAGSINLTAQSIELSGISASGKLPSSITASADTVINPITQKLVRSTGNGGVINIAADQLSVSEGASIRSSTSGDGNGGDINVTAKAIDITGIGFGVLKTGERLEAPSAFSADTAPGATGQGGRVNLVTDQLRLTGGGQISSSTAGAGNANNIRIQANSIDLVGTSASGRMNSGLFSNAVQGTGNGGDIQVTTNRLTIADRATINAGNFETRRSNIAPGQGAAGAVNITAKTVQLNNAGSITVDSLNGDRGNIAIQSDLLLMRNQSLITATARGQSNGGNIQLTVPFIVGLENSDIIANAVQGRGGNIEITTQGIFGLKYRDRQTAESDITASSEFGLNGTVDVRGIGIDPNSGLIQLPIDVVDPNQRIAQGCSTPQNSSFVITGRGGVPANPMEEIRYSSVWIDVRDPDVGRSPMTAQPSNLVSSIVEASNWQRNPQTGNIELIAARSVHPDSATCALMP